MKRKRQRGEFSSSRERSERLDIALSRSNGLSGERVHDLERSTANHVLERSAGSPFLSVQRLLHSRSRAGPSRDDSPSRHPEVLLFRIWAWVSARDGSMIWDESRRTVLHSDQRFFTSGSYQRSAGSPLLSVQRNFWRTAALSENGEPRTDNYFFCLQLTI